VSGGNEGVKEVGKKTGRRGRRENITLHSVVQYSTVQYSTV
jgi:hypothetical protein